MSLLGRVRRLVRRREQDAEQAATPPGNQAPPGDTVAALTAAAATPAGAGAPSGAGAGVPPTPGGPEPAVAVATTHSPEFDRDVPRGLQLAASWSWRVLMVGALVYFLGRVADVLSEVVIPLAIAILLTALLLPAANRMRRWGVPGGLATAVTLLGGIAVIAGALTLIVNSIANQAGELSSNVVAGFNSLVGYLENGPFGLSADTFSTDRWVDQLQTFLTDSRTAIASSAASIGASIGHFFAGLALAVFSLIFFLHDGRLIFTFLLRFFPAHVRTRVDEASARGWYALSHYVRATVIVALVDGIGVLAGALILGVPVAPALAALVFLGAFIPIIGAFVSGFAAVLVALVALGWVQALIMLGIIIGVMQVEGHLLQPFILGRAVKLHPLAVVVAIATGLVVAGIVGALLVVPLLAFTKTFVGYLAGDRPLVPGRRRRAAAAAPSS